MPAFDRNKWNAKYAAGEQSPREPSAVLTRLADYLPKSGRAIDIAGGAGRHGIWLAQRGLDVTIADISPVGLEIARRRAAEAGMTIRTLEVDLEASPFPPGPWDLIVSVCYLWRPLYAVFPKVLAPGGLLAIVQPTRKNLERHPKPPADFLLEEGELPQLVNGLEIVHYEEGWLADGRHDACIVAKHPAPSPSGRGDGRPSLQTPLKNQPCSIPTRSSC
ncbi:MAG: class I SAM-dependent methyltransferase [Pirellulaceae bacterium]|nr:class I SAM-dependent methyltransferase [Pirellulaceae bacterium]